MQRALAQLEQFELDSLLVTTPENVRYLSGFTSPEDGEVILGPEGALLLTDGRYTVEAARVAKIPYRIVAQRGRDEIYRELLKGKVGFEAEHLTVARLEALRRAVPVDWRSTSKLIENLRLYKTPAEVALIQQAATIADSALAEILPNVHPGLTELELALDLEAAMRKGGAEGIAFTTIVASGERSAMPHGAASSKPLAAGELITVDFGAFYAGYHSDMTRTFALGQLAQELEAIFNAVLEAEETVLAAVRPGIGMAELDHMAREVLEKFHYAQYFTHSLGHGVGLAIHEAPALWSGAEGNLEAGMIITIEPGVYIPGLGGCRIEDLVYVDEKGYQTLSHAPKALYL